MLQKVTFAQIEAIVPDHLSKSFILNEDNSVSKTIDGQLTKGMVNVYEYDMHRMLTYVNNLTPRHALTYGTPEHRKAVIMSSSMKKRYDSNTYSGYPVIGRNNNDFKWNHGPGLLMLDHDILDEQEPYTKEQLLETLYSIWPALEKLHHIWAPSASSCIRYPDGTTYRGLMSQRLLVPLAKGFDVPRVLDTIVMKLWLLGGTHGFIRISKSGQQLIRSVIDACTKQPSRLDFIGGAYLQGGLYSYRKELIEGFNLDAQFPQRDDYPKLTRNDRRQYDRLVVLAKRRKAKEARRVRDIWVRERVDAALAKVPLEQRDAKRSELERIYGHAVEQGELTGDFLLWSHKFSEWVAVEHILDYKAKYDQTQFADPMEPEHEDKRPAIVYLSREPATLYSHFHGGMSYVLKRERRFPDTLKEGEQKLREFIKLDGNTNIIVTPGVGKTTEALKDAIRRLSEADEGVIIYSTVRHDLINENIERIGVPENIEVVHYQGRFWAHDMKRKNNKGKVRNCAPRYFEETEQARKLGYGEAEIVCRRCDYSPWNSGKTCGYWRQFDNVGKRTIIFCTPQAVKSIFEKVDQKIMRLYIDEQSVEAVIERTDPLTSDALKTLQLKLSKKSYEVVKDIIDLTDDIVRETSNLGLTNLKVFCHPYNDELGVKELADDIPSDKLALLRHELNTLLYPHENPVSKKKLHDKYELYLSGTNLNAAKWLYTFTLPKSTRNAWFDVDLSRADGFVTYCQNEIHRLPNVPLTILDATGSIQESEALFDRKLKLLEINVGWQGTGIWIKKKLGQRELRKLTDEHIEELIQNDILDRIPAGTRKGFLATRLNDEERILKILKRLTPTIEWKSTHYWGARGLNSFEDCDFGLSFGYVYKHVGSMQDDSRTIFLDNLKAREQWEKGQDVNEHAQTDHRLRLVRNPGRTLIVYGPIYPTELLGRPSFFDDYYDTGEFTPVELAAERALDFIDKFGFCSRAYCLMMSIGRQGDCEKMTFLQECLRSKYSKHMSDYIDRIVSHMLKVAEENIISTDQTFWQQLWSEVLLRRPSLTKLEVRHALIDKRNYSHGVGNVESGERTDATLAEYIPEFVIGKWRAR